MEGNQFNPNLKMFNLTNTKLLPAIKKKNIHRHLLQKSNKFHKKTNATKQGIIPSVSGDEDIDNLTILVEQRVEIISSGS